MSLPSVQFQISLSKIGHSLGVVVSAIINQLLQLPIANKINIQIYLDINGNQFES
jgi:hypothetical protein